MFRFMLGKVSYIIQNCPRFLNKLSTCTITNKNGNYFLVILNKKKFKYCTATLYIAKSYPTKGVYNKHKIIMKRIDLYILFLLKKTTYISNAVP